MINYSQEIIYIGFLLPAIFSMTLVAEGIYKIHKHEEGLFTFLIGVVFIISLGIFYILLFPR